jgi:hypothetical protein
MTVAPRFVRMLLSTSWAHCEAVYKRAGSIPSVPVSRELGRQMKPRALMDFRALRPAISYVRI